MTPGQISGNVAFAGEKFGNNFAPGFALGADESMISDEIRLQLHGDIRELELTAGEYPRDSAVRYAFLGFANVLRKYELSEDDKRELVMALLKDVQPCSKSELVERLEFSRDESRRLVTLLISGGLIETFPDTEPTNGRPATMLRIP